MKRQSLFVRLHFCSLLFLVVTPTYCQIRPQDTVVPNQYEFTSARYFVSKGATNTVITVRFFPGSRAWSGSVSYATRDGTASANQDYTPVSGALSFSGMAYRSFTVPLIAGALDQQKTILLVLTPGPFDANAIILRSNAVLNINLPPPPKLAITPGTSGTVVISWPDDSTEPLLEKCLTPSGTNWSVLAPVSTDGSGQCCYTDVASPGMALYRLRRSQ